MIFSKKELCSKVQVQDQGNKPSRTGNSKLIRTKDLNPVLIYQPTAMSICLTLSLLLLFLEIKGKSA